jgi:sugar phosphate isomerase/epimerase
MYTPIPSLERESTSSRREWLKKAGLVSIAAVGAPALMASAEKTAPPPYAQPIRISVSTYSYWHFKEPKYPIEKVIEESARLGFDGVEILHRQMDNETIPYMNKLKRMAFENGLALPMLSIHQNFVKPDAAERKKDIEHTIKCIGLATQMGIPYIRLNSGRWNTAGTFDELMKVRGKEAPLPGYTDDDAFKWCIDAIGECLKEAEKAGVILAIENHWGLTTQVDGLLKIYQAHASSPAMGMNVDTGNFAGDPYSQFEKLAPYATIVQAKTYYGGGNWYTFDLDYQRIATILRKANFKGYVSLEMEGKENAATAVPKSLAILRKAFSVPA